MTIFEQATALKQQIKDIRTQADRLKQQLIAEMPEIEKIEAEYKNLEAKVEEIERRLECIE